MGTASDTTTDPGRAIGRDWDLPVSIPAAAWPRVVESCLAGTPTLRIESERVNALLCALPKSAGLYLAQLLSLSLDLRNCQIGFDLAGGGVYYPRLLATKLVPADTISHCHAEATRTTLRMIRTLELRPIVLTRPLLDALVSRRDMLVAQKQAGNLLAPAAMRAFLLASDAERLDVVIDLFAPAYLNFVAGWEVYRHASDPAILFATYDEVVERPLELAERVAAFLERPFRPARVEAAAETIRSAGGVNFATGRPGRGVAAFDDGQVERLRRLACRLGCTNADFLGFEA